MSETTSSLSNDLSQFYRPKLSVSIQDDRTRPATLFSSNEPSNTTMVTTTTVSRSSSGLIHERRVSKPIRKRSRTSKRTPTTFLNTDTTNFRAMVQQFTGGPMAPFVSVGSYPTGANMSLGYRNSQTIVYPNTVVVPMARYNAVQFQQQQQQFLQQQYLLSANNSGSVGDRSVFCREPVIVDSGGGYGMEGSFSSTTPSSNKDMAQLITCYEEEEEEEEEMMDRGGCNNFWKGNIN